LLLLCLTLLAACGSSTAPQVAQLDGKAVCGPGSMPETGLQGQVSAEDRESGRSQQGYRCNLELVGQYQGEGASWVNPSYGHCAYLATSFGGIPTKKSQGVQVVDVSDPQHPVLAGKLTSLSMLLGPWESLKVHEGRGLLGGVAVGPAVGAGFFDLYDISEDCTQPKLLNSFTGNLTLPTNFLAHEGAFSPDGKTYWSTGAVGGSMTAIAIDDPAHPRIVYQGLRVLLNHGFSFSDDGRRMYLSMGVPAGIVILDIGDVQDRAPIPVVREVGSLYWNLLGYSQQSVPVRYGGQPYLIVADEFASEGVHIVDLTDETNPVDVTHLQLEIQKEEHLDARRRDTTGNGLFGYEAHYCTVDRHDDPTAMACGYFQSGIRVFDIRDPRAPREIAYFNPPAQVGKTAMLRGSEHAAGLITALGVPASDLAHFNFGTYSSYILDPTQLVSNNLSADWCGSPPRFVGDQLWVTCQDNGFMVLRFTNGVYPLE